MGRIQPFLSPLAIKDLIEYIAVNGENYEKYSAYADKRGWKKFTPQYLHNWVRRHRDPIQTARAVHLIEVKKALVLDRQRRLNEAEANAMQLQHRIINGQGLESDELVKLMDMHRKLMQHIATERGEWGHKEDNSQDLSELHALLQKRMQKALRDPNVIDGESREIE